MEPSARASYAHAHHDYPAADIFAPCGSDVVAPTAGTVVEVSDVDRWDPAVNDPATRGGLSIAIVGTDGVRYYGSHLQHLDPRATPGADVREGDVVGSVGESGNALGTGCHLHFGLSPACGVGDWEVRRGVVAPWTFLDAWRDGDATASPLRIVAQWLDENRDRCPAAPG